MKQAPPLVAMQRRDLVQDMCRRAEMLAPAAEGIDRNHWGRVLFSSTYVPTRTDAALSCRRHRSQSFGTCPFFAWLPTI